MIPPFIDADWRMDAPDEVSVTNCLVNVAMPILSAILAQRAPEAAFIHADSRQADALKTVMTGGRRISPGSNITKAQPTGAGQQDDQVIRSELRSWLENLG